MVNQQIFLPMVPDSAPIVVNINQGDYDATGYAGRLIFNVVNEGQPYDTDGATAVFQGEKPDGHAFAYPATVVSASVVRVNVKPQMTNVSGRVVCQLILRNSDGVIGSFNIWLEVQPSAISGADPSQTDIPSLVAQAEIAADRAEDAADIAEVAELHPPYIGVNGDWFVFDLGTELYTDSGVKAYGNKWYFGTAVSGKQTTPQVFNTGIPMAYVGDGYVNETEGAIYKCTTAGDDTTAKWAFSFQITGGGGASTLAALSDVGIVSATNGDLLIYDDGYWKNYAPDAAPTALSTKPVQSGGVYTALAGKANTTDLDTFTPSVTCYTDSSLVKVQFDDLNESYGYQLFFDDQNQTLPNPIPSQSGDPVKTSGTNTGIKLTYTLSNATAGTHKFALRILK